MSRISKPAFYSWLSALLIALIAAVSTQPALAQSSIDVVVHYVEGTPSETDISYTVKAFVSVVDSTGSPVNGLKAEDFVLAEDSQQVEIKSVSTADEPISIVLLMDTSGSMTGTGINAAKSAAASFVTSLSAEDRVAVVTFNDAIETVVDFTTDHQSARDRISLIDATRGAGTCLYDAAYRAVQMTATVPSGRRAVVLFTDGVDEKASGGLCSVNTADDVIKIATEGGTRTPVYTMGMGRVDENTLKRLAGNTGGRYFYSPDANRVDVIFRELSNSLRSQYAIEYSSTAGPGGHTLAVTARYLNSQDTDTRSFLLPNFPLRLTFSEPAEGAEVSGETTVRVETFGQGETIQAVLFQIDGETVATVSTGTYTTQIDFGAYLAGELTIEAVAQGAGGIELARASRTVEVIPRAVEPTPIVDDGDGEGISEYLIYILGGVLLLVVAFVFILIVFLRKRKERQRDLEWEQKVGGVGAPTVEEFSSGSDATMDSWEMPSDAYGRLIVLASDDSAMINQHFDITHSRTALGRKADNDIIFPKDSPVSRHHAVIEERNGGLFLEEVEDDGKLPTYNTFVNERDVRGDAILLQSGDEIRLGKRVRLRFEAGTRIQSGDDVTHDGFSEDTMDTQMQ